MKILISVIFVLLLVVVVSAQEGAPEQILTIKDFKGLNTRANQFSIQPNEARIAEDIDFSRRLGAIMKRYGYSAVDTFSGQDSILAMFPAYYENGTQRLFIASDSLNVGYGQLWIGRVGSADLTIGDSMKSLTPHWGVKGKTNFAMFNDIVYISNSTHRGANIKDSTFRWWPPLAPGEAIILPLADTGSNSDFSITGEYRYRVDVMPFDADSAINRFPGYITHPISVSGGRALIKNLQIPVADSITSTLPDSVRINIYRTHANPGGLDETDSCALVMQRDIASVGLSDIVFIDSIPDTMTYWRKVTPTNAVNAFTYIDSFLFEADTLVASWTSPGSGTTIGMVADSMVVAINGTANLQDSVTAEDSAIFYAVFPDVALSQRFSIVTNANQSVSVGPWTGEYIDVISESVWRGWQGAGVQNRTGAPGYVTSSTSEGSLGNLYTGIPVQDDDDTLGVYYAVTIIDTITGVESDTGRGLVVTQRVGATLPPQQITLNLPHFPTNDSGLAMNLYRAHVFVIGYDSSTWSEYQPNSIGPVPASDWRYITPDSLIMTDLYLLAQLELGDSSYTDFIPYDSLIQRRLYTKTTPPALLDDIFAHDGRMWGIQGSRLWYSDLINGADTIQRWGQMEFININPNDGDENTLAYPARGVVRTYKNYSSYNVYQNSNLQWSLSEVNKNIGCIAPRSHAAGLGGHYYLSDQGVIRENDGMQLDRTSNVELISARLDNFDKLSLVARRSAIGFYFDRKYMLSIPLVDTIYVYDELADAWSTWSFAFNGALKYGVENTIGFLPGDTMYFFDDSILYRYGDSESDNGFPISYTWWSGPILTDPHTNQVSAVGLWVTSADASSDSGLSVVLYNETNTVAATRQYGSLSSKKQHLKSFVPTIADYYTIYIGRFHPDYTLDTTAIDRIDIYWKILGLPKRF